MSKLTKAPPPLKKAQELVFEKGKIIVELRKIPMKTYIRAITLYGSGT